ncbi:MAG: hypothetical protein AAF420_06790 [Pseudomonadota bacterium]
MQRDCPYCGEAAISTQQNMCVSPFHTLTCSNCGEEIVIKWRHYAVVLLAIAAFFTSITVFAPGVGTIAILFVVLGCFISVYQTVWLPLSKK